MRQGFVDLHAEWPLVRKMEIAASTFRHDQREETGDVDSVQRGDAEQITYEAAIER